MFVLLEDCCTLKGIILKTKHAYSCISVVVHINGQVYTIQTQLQSHISFFYWYIKKCWRLMRTMYKSMLWRWTGKNLKWHVGVMNRQLLVSSTSLSLLQFNCSSSEMRFLNYRFVVHTIFLFSVHTFFYGFNVLVLNSSVDQT